MVLLDRGLHEVASDENDKTERPAAEATEPFEAVDEEDSERLPLRVVLEEILEQILETIDEEYPRRGT